MASSVLDKPLHFQHAEKGFSLTELLIGTALAGMVLAMLAGLFQSAAKLTELLRIRKQEFYTLLRVEALLREAMEGVDTHRLHVFPIVHSRGDLRYADGTAHPLTLRRDSLSPSPTSDALTWISVNTRSLRWIREISEVRRIREGNYEIDAEECSSTVLSRPADERSLLGLSTEGIFELQVLSRRVAGPCTYYTLSLAKSIILPNRVTDGRILLTVRAVLSIQQVGTLYLDREARLRLVTHSGEETLENQPVLEEIKELQLQSTSLEDDAARIIEAELSLPSGRVHIISLTHHLTRRPLLETLFLARLL